jgi:hypothetical protein
MRHGIFAAGAALALVIGTSAPAFAHHGWGWYGEQPFELTGTVESANMAGAHGQLRVRSGNEVWDVVLAPPARNERAGLTAEQVKAGTTVTARGHRWKEGGRLEVKTERLVIGDKTYDLYPERD